MVQIIAIDGPAGSGKSSVSKEVASKLGFGYLDTGAAYRALAWAVTEGKLPLPTADFPGFDYQISMDPNNFWVRSFGEDVTEEIRDPKISESVSAVAQITSVRAFMKVLTRQLVEASGFPGVVVEGRDITTVVAPEAQVRILLTADESVRLARRAKELSAEQLSTLEAGLQRRDAIDSKVVDFLKPADGVTLVDSTELNFEQTVHAVLSIIREH
jgi:cytidylate kinase